MAKYILKQAAIFALTNEANTHSNPVKRAYTRAAAIIEQITEEDVQPVKHGRWLPSTSYITTAYGTIHCQICSECEAELMEDNDYNYDFCPVCGARMDGDPDV